MYKNVHDPINTGVDWTLNGNSHAPITTFAAAGRITYDEYATDSVINGVYFDGNDTERANSGLLVNDGAVLLFEDGTKGNNPTGTELYTESIVTRFNNTTGTGDETTGGVMLVKGDVKITGATFSYNNSIGVKTLKLLVDM